MNEPEPETYSSDSIEFSDETEESETDWESLIDAMSSCHLAEKREIIDDIEKVREILLSIQVTPETENLRKLFTESIQLLQACSVDDNYQSCSAFAIEIRSKFSGSDLKIFLENLGVDKSRFPSEESNFLLPQDINTTLIDNHVYMASINNYHYFVFCIHDNKVYVFQSFIGKYLPKLFIFEKEKFLYSLYSLFFDIASIRNTGQEKQFHSYPNFLRAFSFLTGVHPESDPQVDIFFTDTCGYKILSTVVLRFLDITDNIQCLSEPEPERGSKRKYKRKSKKKKSRKRKKTKKKSRKR